MGPGSTACMEIIEGDTPYAFGDGRIEIRMDGNGLRPVAPENPGRLERDLYICDLFERDGAFALLAPVP